MSLSGKILFKTDRLYVCEHVMENFDYVHAYAKDPEFSKYQAWGPNSEDDTIQFLTEAIQFQTENPRNKYELSIREKQTGKGVGGCSIYIDKEDTKQALLGYAFSPLQWGKGYATEVSIGLLQFAHKSLGIRIISATCDTNNLASKRVLEKTGFTLKQTIRDHFIQKGKMRSSFLFELKFA